MEWKSRTSKLTKGKMETSKNKKRQRREENNFLIILGLYICKCTYFLKFFFVTLKSIPLNAICIGHTRCTTILEDGLAVSYKLNTLLPYDSNWTPQYLSKQAENLCLHKSCTWIFIVVLFVITKTWKHPQCPLVGERIK